jgi:hypothetical protein
MMPTFKQVATCEYGQGNSILLWKDKWASDTLQATWPHLFLFSKNDSISLQPALETSDFTDLFHLPVSEEAMVQLNLFQTMLQNLLHGDGYDSWSIFGSSKSYKVSQLYKDMMRNDGTIFALK